MSIAALCADLREEAAALRALVTSGALGADTETPFMGWRVRNGIQHIVTIDRLATLAFSDPDAGAIARGEFVAGTTPAAGGLSDVFSRIAAYEQLRLGLLSWEQLLGAWDLGLEHLCAAATAFGDADRVQWFGGAMRGESLIAARHMEVWAYGQDIFDAADATRPEGARLRNVVEFGLKTFAFSFANRGETAPIAKPFLSLASPDGKTWTWNDPAATDRISGAARDFALVVTQRRHVADTGLEVIGPTAARWMAIAQCIAGAPVDGPPPRGR